MSGLADGLRRRGHRVDRLAPTTSTDGLARRLLFNLRLPLLVGRCEADVLVSFDLDGCFLAGGGLPWIACLKGIAADELRFEEGGPRMRLAAQARLERRAARRADRVVVPSRYSRDVAARAYGVPPERLAVVPEAIDFSLWSEPLEAEPDPGARETPSGPVVLSVARQYPRKNTGALLRALPSVRRRVPGTTLRVVGGGPRLPALRGLSDRLELGDAVSFLGELGDRAAVRREYARADLFCLPSRQEGFGIVFLEAMASGLPVVAGDAAAVPEVVPDGEAGVLVPPDDVEALGRALVRLLSDEELRLRMGRRGRARARSFDRDRVTGQFLDVVDGLLEEVSRPEPGAGHG